jgi:hypothetical protein
VLWDAAYNSAISLVFCTSTSAPRLSLLLCGANQIMGDGEMRIGGYRGLCFVFSTAGLVFLASCAGPEPASTSAPASVSPPASAIAAPKQSTKSNAGAGADDYR